MRTKQLLTFLIAATVAIGGLISSATAAPPRAGVERPSLMERMTKGLDLSPEQAEKIKAELEAEKDDVVPLLKRLHEARKDLRETIQADSDEKAIRAAHAKVAAVEADLAVHRAKVRAKIVPHLTEEQLQKLKKFEARMDEAAEHGIDRLEKRLQE